MPLYEFQALTKKGKKQTGQVNAESLFSAKNKLKKTDLIILSIHKQKKNQSVLVKKQEILSFTRELAKLLEAGLPLFECLSAVEEKSQGQKIHTIVLDLMEKVKQGDSLSSALELHQKNFDPLYIQMVKSGEKSGKLQEVLQEISSLISKQMILKKKIIRAVSYPTLLMGFSFLILFALFFFIIPSLEPLFEDRELHAFTSCILFISRTLIAHQTTLSLLSSLGLCFLLFFSKSDFCKEKFYHFLLKIPSIKDLLIKFAFIRFCRSSSTLLEAGVPLLDTLDLAKNMLSQPTLIQLIKRARKGILAGSSLSKELSKSPYVPHFVVRMILISEKSGKSPEMLRHISQIYEEEFDSSLEKITALLQPILMLLIGIIVGVVLLSVLLPLTDVSSFID